MKIAIYSRKSKYTGKGDSIGNQIQMCKDYIETHYRDKDHEFVIYEDEGFSGGNINRPKFQALLSDIKKEKFDILICYRLDRISRNVSDFSATLEELQSYGVDFISIKEQFDTTTPMGRAMIYIASVFAQLERETIAERVKDNMVELAKSGKWSGGTPPLGYKSESETYIDENGKERTAVRLTINDDEVPLVNHIFDTYLKEGSLYKTEAALAVEKLTSKNGIRFQMATIKIILENPIYAISTQEVKQWLEDNSWNVYGDPDGIHSYISYNKTKVVQRKGKTTKVRGNIEDRIASISNFKGIIEASKWIQVQQQLKGNKKLFPKKGKTHDARLVGKIFCEKCGRYMSIYHGRILPETQKRQLYYVCSYKKLTKSQLCNSKNVKVDELEDLVLYKLEEIGKNKKDFIAKLKKKNESAKNKNSAKEKQRLLEKDITTKETILNNLIDKLAMSSDIEDLLIERIKSTKLEIQELQNELDELNKELGKTDYTNINLEIIESLIDKCANIRNMELNEQILLIGLLIDKVYWNSDTKNITVHFIGSEFNKKK